MNRVTTALTAAASAITLALGLAACSSTAPTTKDSAGKGDKVVVGFANALNNDPTFIAMANVMKAQVKKRGWQLLLLNNNVDGPTALKNADIMVARHVDYAVEFQVDSSVQPVIAKKLGNAHIPEITFDIPAPGAYFLGAPNMKAGQLAGEQLGKYAEKTWDCKPDLILDMTQVTAGAPSTLRTNGIAIGIKQECPNIKDSDILKRDGGSTAATAQAAGRDLLAAHPDAKKILVGGLSDTPVVGVITAAKQLGRTDQLFGWGDDGSALLGGNPPAQLKGSVAFFLEGYPMLALQLIDKLVAGKNVPVGDTPTSPDGIFVNPCVVTAADASKVPGVQQRATKLAAAPTSATASALFCPTK